MINYNERTFDSWLGSYFLLLGTGAGTLAAVQAQRYYSKRAASFDRFSLMPTTQNYLRTFNHALAYIIYAWKCFSTFRYTRRDFIKHSTAKEVYLRRTKEQPAGDNSVSLSCLYSIMSSCSHPIFGSLIFQSNRANFAQGVDSLSSPIIHRAAAINPTRLHVLYNERARVFTLMYEIAKRLRRLSHAY
ncbi:hypothetical protein KQX54_021086 [Cotesia glomerata]|uniref:Uncharacterized protein n=1 Tax=Cotesia glomerata TaxID=32391 RepID=A0AAV7J6R3_COTGL|nr:hypothetical protein KQX54_021086 [Cotesia glomerata]